MTAEVRLWGSTKISMNLANDGHYGAAMEKAFFALRLAPSFLPLHVTIGDILVEQNKISGAVTKYLSVADVYTVQGKTERALAMLDKVIDLQPMNIEIRQRQIDLLEEYGKKEEAIQEYINVADVFFPLAEFDSARSAYIRALELTKTIQDDGSWKMKLLQRLADLDIQRLDWDSAIETYQEITEISPRNLTASTAIVDLSSRLGKQAAAEKEIERFIMLFNPESEANDVRDYLLYLKKEMPTEDYIVRQLVDFYKSLGQNEMAISELDGLGDLLLEAGDKPAAIGVIEEIISLAPPNIEAYQKLLRQLKA